MQNLSPVILFAMGNLFRNNWVKIRVLTTLVISLFVIAPLTTAFPTGISGNAIDYGCACHGSVAEESVSIQVSGFPDQWVIGESYELTIQGESSVVNDGENQGGFNLKVEGGILSSHDESVHIIDGEATHTEEGNDQREWSVTWTAPSRGTQKINWRVYVNTVNGDGTSDAGDSWNIMSSSIVGPDKVVTNDWTDSKTVRIVMGLVASMIIVKILPHSGGMSKSD